MYDKGSVWLEKRVQHLKPNTGGVVVRISRGQRVVHR